MEVKGLPRHCVQRNSMLWLRFKHPILGSEVWRPTGLPIGDFDAAQQISASLRVLVRDKEWHEWSAYVAAYGKFNKIAVSAFYKLRREHPRYAEAAMYTEIHEKDGMVQKVVLASPEHHRKEMSLAAALFTTADEKTELAKQLDQERGEKEMWRDRALAAESRAGVTGKSIPPWRELCAQYLAALQHRGRNGKTVSPVHARQRERHLTTHTRGKEPNIRTIRGYWEALNLDVTRIDPSVIENQRAAMLAAGDARKTVSMRVESLKALLSWCVRVGYLVTNPLVNRLETFAVTPKTKRRRLKQLELTALLRVAPPDRRLVYKLAVVTGYRKNELRTRTVGDYDRETRTIFLDAAHAKNGQDAHSMPLAMSVAAELEASIKGKLPTEPLVPLSFHIDAQFKRDLAKAGVKYEPGQLVYHSLRRCTASILSDNRASVKDQMDGMRHSDPEMTVHYTDSEEAEKVRLSEALGRAVG